MEEREHPAWLSEVVFRQAVESDLPALEWNGQFQHFRQIYQDIYRLSLRGEATIWVAELPEVELIGQLFVQLKSARFELADGKSSAYIFGFRVKPEYRSFGVGSRMMEWVEEDLLSKGYKRVNLNVNHDNIRARNLYERLGYRVIGEEPGNWSYIDDKGKLQDVNEPAWRMGKKLT